MFVSVPENLQNLFTLSVDVVQVVPFLAVSYLVVTKITTTYNNAYYQSTNLTRIGNKHSSYDRINKP